MIATILGVLQSILAAIPALDRIIAFFKKTPQEKVDESVKEGRDEIDEFKRTGRPPR